MNLQKENWEKVKLGEICKLVYGKSLKKGNRNGGKIPVYGSAGIVGWHNESLTKSPSIIVGRKGSIGNVFYSDVPCFPIDTTYFVEQHLTKANLIWLNIVLNHFDLSRLNMASAIPGINRNVVHQIDMLLPPLEEQKIIADLFQSIDDSIEQAEEQEKNLRALAKRLIDGLICDEPTFGNLLESKELAKVKYADVAVKMTRRIDLSNTDVERIVAGENMESEDFKIRSWGIVGKDYVGSAFHMNFWKGDILYGSRRTYLKKVSFAEFDGVCSNTTYVIKANEEIILQGLLKHIMLSESFTQYSISVSKGSTNPYINWKDLDNFTFYIPDIETQEKIVSILDEIIEIAEQTRTQKETLKNLKFKLLNEILG